MAYILYGIKTIQRKLPFYKIQTFTIVCLTIPLRYNQALFIYTQLLIILSEFKLTLTHTEAVIIDELFRHPNEVVEAKTLMYRIWQNDDYNNLNRLHGFIYKLRKYLSKSTGLELLNVRGIGYKLAIKTRV